MSTYRPNQDELAREQRLVNDELWQGERGWLSEFLLRLNQASIGDELFAAHVSLVARLRVRQDHILKLRKHFNELSCQRSELLQDLRPLQQPEPRPHDVVRDFSWADSRSE